MEESVAFRAETEPHRRELLVHCYRMLGSLADAEDALQEAMVHAWRARDSFEGRSSLRRWLYRITTNVCLDALKSRRARSLPVFVADAGDPGRAFPPPIEGEAWLEPLPEHDLADDTPNPADRLAASEGVALAFLAALQALPPSQRAILILRDVLGYTAAETAEILDVSVAAANSALQRARESLEQRRVAVPGGEDRSAVGGEAIAAVLRRFVAAWETGSADALVSLLREDAAFSMPPMPLWFGGRDDIRAFFHNTLFVPGIQYRLLPTRANGAPAFGVYRAAGAEPLQPAILVVLAFTQDAIAAIHSFHHDDPAQQFKMFGLPVECP